VSLVLVLVNVIFDVVEDEVIVVLLSDIPSEELLEAVPLLEPSVRVTPAGTLLNVSRISEPVLTLVVGPLELLPL